MTVPLVLPPVVGGVALLLLLGRRGVLGQYLDLWFGLRLPFTTAAVVVAEAFVALPFLVIAVEGALRGADRRFEDAAATLGASRATVFRRVTLPLVAPGVTAGAVLCFARALGEFGATITFAGNFPGVTRTMPLSVYLALETDPESAIVLSLVLLLVSVVVLALPARPLGGGDGHVTPRPAGLRADLGVDRDGVRPRPGARGRTRRGGGAARPQRRRQVDRARGARRPGSACRAGGIELDGTVLDDPAADVLVPAERRRTGVVFQDYLLFPHLSVLDNVAFGLRSRGVPRQEAATAAHGWLERVGLADLARSRPGRISGGQAQRVALARALVTEPALLLLDEPLAALDAQTRLDVRSDLRRHLAGYDGCTVLVTHDPLDAMVLADRIVVVENGVAVQRGTPAEVARAPRTEYVARLVGLNLYRGRADGADRPRGRRRRGRRRRPRPRARCSSRSRRRRSRCTPTGRRARRATRSGATSSAWSSTATPCGCGWTASPACWPT